MARRRAMAPERSAAPWLLELELAAAPERWHEAGFATDAAEGTALATLGGVKLRLLGGEAGRGIARWALGGLRAGREPPDGAMDGLPTVAAHEAASPPGRAHPNGVAAIDHVVAFSPDLDRTVAALRADGLDFRRLRDGPTAAGAQRQAFFRVGEPLLEVIEHPLGVPAAADPDAPPASGASPCSRPISTPRRSGSVRCSATCAPRSSRDDGSRRSRAPRGSVPRSR